MKNIVIFSDGTCNEGDKGYPTNVNKMYQVVKRRCKEQVAFYDPGVGTDFHKITGAAFGIGISKNIRECYEYLVDYYESGAKIFLFGFSRGAYTVRSLAGMVDKVGVLKRTHRDQANRAFKLYKKKNNEEEVELFIKKCCWQADAENEKPEIFFIGVWDTVSALGIPLLAFQSLNPFSARWHGFHDPRLPERVAYGYQALAIDEKRKIFNPEIWQDSTSLSQVMEQTWFAGVHSNLGGGYRRTGLSDISLEWMIQKGEKAGLLLWDNYREKVLMAPDPSGKMYDSRTGIAKLYVKADRKIPKNARIHTSVISRINDGDTFYAPNNLPESYVVCDRDNPVSDVETVPPPGEITVQKFPVKMKIMARKKWTKVGVEFREGHKYRLSVTGIWYDASIGVSCCGYSAASFTGIKGLFFKWAESRKRVPTADWFSLICTVGKDTEHAFDLGNMIKESDCNVVEYTAGRSGSLYCFANDLSFMYRNNRDFVVITVEEASES